VDKLVVIEELKEIIKKTMEIEISNDMMKGENLIEEFGINSVDALEILVWIENTFDITFPDEDLGSDLLLSIDGLADYILNRKETF